MSTSWEREAPVACRTAMRRALVLFTVACGSTPRAVPLEAPVPVAAPVAAPVVPAGAPEPVVTAPPPEPPLAMLASKGEVVLLITEEGKPRCQAWQIEPGQDGAGQLRHHGEWISYTNAGAKLKLTHRGRSRNRGGESAHCGLELEAREIGDGLDVSGARWFRRAEDCERAIATRQRVATDLHDCELGHEATLRDQGRAQERFEAMLERGGVAYAILDDRCDPLHADPRKPTTRDVYQGSLWSTIREGKLTGKYAYGYVLVRGQLEITMLGPSTTWSDGSGSAFGCGGHNSISYGKDTVTLGQPLYLSLASCRTALAEERGRLAWLPKPAPEDGGEQIAGSSTPSLGGC
jgi:hypothetical protein